MTLPIAVVERWPMEEYKLQYTDQCIALKHSCGRRIEIVSRDSTVAEVTDHIGDSKKANVWIKTLSC
jgi:hypothetical protein